MEPIPPEQKDTSIVYNEKDPTAVIDTFDRALIGDLKRRGVKGTEKYGGQWRFVVPVEWIAVRPPKKYNLTDEQKAERAERMREVATKRKE